MSKLLLEALKNVDEKVMTPEVIAQVQEAFESAVEKDSAEKVSKLQESLVEATKAMSATILESFVLDQKALFEKAVDAKAETLSKDGLEKIQEEADVKMKADLEEINENVQKYVEHVADVFLKENMVAMQDEIEVKKANAIMESASAFAKGFSIDLDNITSEDESKQALSEAVDASVALKAELKVLKAEKVLTEAKVGLTLLQADKLDSLCESKDIEDVEAFTKEVDAIKEALVIPASTKIVEKKDDKKEKQKASWQ